MHDGYLILSVYPFINVRRSLNIKKTLTPMTTTVNNRLRVCLYPRVRSTVPMYLNRIQKWLHQTLLPNISRPIYLKHHITYTSDNCYRDTRYNSSVQLYIPKLNCEFFPQVIHLLWNCHLE